METKNQDRISELVEKQKDTYTSMADEIWGYAEPRFQEYESSRVQQEYLASRGFSIRADLAGEKTAFIAEWGSGKPVLAFLGEFDRITIVETGGDHEIDTFVSEVCTIRCEDIRRHRLH